MSIILKSIGAIPNIQCHYYECDDKIDMNNLDTKFIPMGSRCYVINDGQLYSLNSLKEWKINPIRNSGSDPGALYIYDGGRL